MLSARSEEKWTRLDWALLAAAFLAAVALRLAFLAGAAGHAFFQSPIMDMAYHDAWARRIVAGDFWGTEPFFRAPLYPYVLSLLYWLGGGSITFARVVQAFVGGISAALCFLVAREAFGRRVAALAAFVLAAAWTAIYFDVELLLVVLEIPLGLAFIYFIQLLARKRELWLAAAAGAALGINAITRPNILLVGGLIWLVFLVVPGVRMPRRRLLAALALLYGVAAIPLGAVAVRNYVISGERVLISWQGGVNLWIGNNPSSDGMTAIVPGTNAGWSRGHYEMIRRAENEVGRSLSPAEVDHHYFRKVFAFARAEPARFFRLLVRKAYIFTNAYEVANNFDLYYLRAQFALLKYDPLGSYVIFPLALFGLFVNIRSWRRLAPLYIFVIVYSASVVAFFVNGRYRMPLVPYLSIFAAAALFYFWDNVRAWPRREVIWKGVVLAGLFLYCDADPFKIRGRSSYEAQPRYTMGTIYLGRGELDAAEAEYRAALALPPSIVHADAYNDLGVIAARRGELAAAEDYFRRAVTFEPTYSRGWNNLGNLARQRGDVAAARRYFERAIAADVEDPRAYYFYGKLLAAEGDAEGAEAKFERAVYYQPDFSAAWFELGKLVWQAGDLARARECFAAAVRYRPRGADARAALAAVEHEAGNYAAAVRQYRILLSAGEDARSRYNLACALARLGRADEAMAELKRAVALAPGRYTKLAAADEDLSSLRGRPDFRDLTALR